jgi:lysophospholipase L1-like esterase
VRRRLLKYLAMALAGVALLIGAEVILALNRDYPLVGPEKRIRGTFGDASAPPLKFVILGDSTAVGVGTTPDRSFSWLLADWLGQRLRVDLEVLGVSGATTKDLNRLQVPEALTMKPDLVLIEIGGNDVTHLSTIRTVRVEMGNALDRLKAGGINVVVAGPPHMGTSRAFAQPLRALSGWRGRAVRRAIEAQARKRGVEYVDLSAGTHDEFERFPMKYYSKDWFHPGAGGYRLWAEVMYPTVLKAALRVSSLAS